MMWRASGPYFPRRYDISFKHGLVYWNGAIYVSCKERFNVEQEKFEEFPDFINGRGSDEEDHRIVYFGESYGHFHLLQVNHQKLTLYNFYEMKHDGTGWFLKSEVNVEAVVLSFPQIIRRYLQTTDFHYHAMAVLNVVRGEKEEHSFLVFHIPEMSILRYNLVDKSFYMLCDFESGHNNGGINEEFDEELAICLHFNRSSTYQYIESAYFW
ncbi:F-box protein At5g07610-like [Lycium ferocissimum]|uniref:F-box protein At5g07610-like n=1 Tax=Lycium ferocissimum TaxID=112874 RepID=UPI002814F744|nr:F-box protein At5g07610-like [Lycium ferocissimum]